MHRGVACTPTGGHAGSARCNRVSNHIRIWGRLPPTEQVICPSEFTCSSCGHDKNCQASFTLAVKKLCTAKGIKTAFYPTNGITNEAKWAISRRKRSLLWDKEELLSHKRDHRDRRPGSRANVKSPRLIKSPPSRGNNLAGALVGNFAGFLTALSAPSVRRMCLLSCSSNKIFRKTMRFSIHEQRGIEPVCECAGTTASLARYGS
jgi:hypothetical protein